MLVTLGTTFLGLGSSVLPYIDSDARLMDIIYAALVGLCPRPSEPARVSSKKLAVGKSTGLGQRVTYPILSRRSLGNATWMTWAHLSGTGIGLQLTDDALLLMQYNEYAALQ